MTDDLAPEPLPCGRDADAILEQVATGRAADRDAHQQDCLHCRAALDEYDRLWAPVRESSAEPVTAPPSVVEAALARIRAVMSRPDYGLIESTQGVTRISARVVVAAARVGAQSVPGVRVALSRHLTERSAGGAGPGTGEAGEDPVTAGVAGSSAAIQITLAADYGQDLVALGEQVRRAVTDTVRRVTDLEPGHVTVVIDDVFS